MEDNGYVVIATFSGAKFFVGGYSVRKRRGKRDEDIAAVYARQDVEVLFRQWGVGVPVYELQVMPQDDLREMPPLLVQAKLIFKRTNPGDSHGTLD